MCMHSHMCLHIRMSTHMYTHAHLQEPTQNHISRPKASTASPNLATFSRVSACLASLPLPSPMHGESPRPASHPVGSPGRINFQLTTGGWPGVSTWPEPRQTGCGTRVDYTCRVEAAGGEGKSGVRPMVATFTVVSQPTWRSPRWPGPAIQKFML